MVSPCRGPTTHSSLAPVPILFSFRPVLIPLLLSRIHYYLPRSGPDGHWRGEAPECKEEQYYGRHGRYGRGRHHDYNNDENGDGYGGDSETVASLEAEVEVEWKVSMPITLLLTVLFWRLVVSSTVCFHIIGNIETMHD